MLLEKLPQWHKMPYYTRYNIQCSRGTAVTWGTMYPYPTYWTEVSPCDDSELSHYLTYGADRGRPTHPSSIIPLPEWQACSQWEKQNNLTGVLGWCGRIIIEVRNLPREESNAILDCVVKWRPPTPKTGGFHKKPSRTGEVIEMGCFETWGHTLQY